MSNTGDNRPRPLADDESIFYGQRWKLASKAMLPHPVQRGNPKSVTLSRNLSEATVKPVKHTKITGRKTKCVVGFDCPQMPSENDAADESKRKKRALVKHKSKPRSSNLRDGKQASHNGLALDGDEPNLSEPAFVARRTEFQLIPMLDLPSLDFNSIFQPTDSIVQNLKQAEHRPLPNTPIAVNEVRTDAFTAYQRGLIRREILPLPINHRIASHTSSDKSESAGRQHDIWLDSNPTTPDDSGPDKETTLSSDALVQKARAHVQPAEGMILVAPLVLKKSSQGSRIQRKNVPPPLTITPPDDNRLGCASKRGLDKREIGDWLSTIV